MEIGEGRVGMFLGRVFEGCGEMEDGRMWNRIQ